MISSSVVYALPAKYSYEIPHKYLSGSGNGNFPSRIYCDIFRQLYFWNSYFTLLRVTFFKSNTRSTFWEQLFLQSSCIFEELLFQNSHCFSPRQLFQISKILEKATFSEKQYCALPTFSGELPF